LAVCHFLSHPVDPGRPLWRRRKVYDQTGSLSDSEELSGEAFTDLYNYYRSMFPVVTEEDIDEFQAGYRGSAEETRDLLDYYTRFRGDMDKVGGHAQWSRSSGMICLYGRT
jgi:hypothetical protein